MSTIRISLGLLFLVAALVQMVQPSHGRRKLCGEALSEALDLICVNGFTRRLRRSDQTQDRRRELIRKLKEDFEGAAGEPPAGDSGRKRKLRRHRRNIAHECCKEGCSYDDILDYCA